MNFMPDDDARRSRLPFAAQLSLMRRLTGSDNLGFDYSADAGPPRPAMEPAAPAPGQIELPTTLPGANIAPGGGSRYPVEANQRLAQRLAGDYGFGYSPELFGPPVPEISAEAETTAPSAPPGVTDSAPGGDSRPSRVPVDSQVELAKRLMGGSATFDVAPYIMEPPRAAAPEAATAEPGSGGRRRSGPQQYVENVARILGVDPSLLPQKPGTGTFLNIFLPEVAASRRRNFADAVNLITGQQRETRLAEEQEAEMAAKQAQEARLTMGANRQTWASALPYMDNPEEVAASTPWVQEAYPGAKWTSGPEKQQGQNALRQDLADQQEKLRRDLAEQQEALRREMSDRSLENQITAMITAEGLRRDRPPAAESNPQYLRNLADQETDRAVKQLADKKQYVSMDEYRELQRMNYEKYGVLKPSGM